MRPLVILRPEPGASATASAARELGLTAIVMPLFAIEPVAWRVPSTASFDGLLLTSANAVRHGGAGLERLKALKTHCIGETTAFEARNAGFEVASVGNSNVDALLGALAAGLRLLHLGGIDRRLPADPKQIIERIPVYHAMELPPPTGLARIEGAVAAVHSPRAAARLASLADETGLRRERIAVAAISPATAEAGGPGWQRIEAAPKPTDEALLVLASELCQNIR